MAEKSSSKRKTILTIGIVLVVAFFILHYVLKSSCTGADPVHDYFIMSFLPQLGNSGVVFLVLWWFGAPMLSEMVANRKKTIESDIEECRKLKEAAIAQNEEIEAKQQTLESEIKKLRVSYSEAAANESANIAQEAEQQAKRIRDDAEAAFELQSNMSLRAFENEIKDKAIERARKEIMERLSTDSALRDRLIDQSIASLEL